PNGCGGSGGGGGQNYCFGSSCSILNGNFQTPGNAGDPDLCLGCAVGGNGGVNNATNGTNGGNGLVVIEITKQTNMIPNLVTTSVTCHNLSNGSATLTITNGTAPYSYTWLPTNTTNSYVNNISAGNYTVLYSDASGCVKQQTFSITQPLPLNISSITTKSVTCYAGSDGNATVTVSGGTGPYSYTWLPTGGNSSVAVGLTCGTVQPNPSMTYTVMVNDNNNCGVVSSTVQIKGPPKLMPHVMSTKSVSCNGANNGSVTILTTGGVGYFPGANLTYTYSFAPGNFTLATTNATVTNLSPALYTVTVYDSNGCNDTVMFNIPEPAPLSLTVVQQQSVSCYGGYDGIASCTVSGGTPFYTYYWYDASNNIVANQSVANFLPQGTYSVGVFDVNGCSIGGTVSIVQPTSAVSISVRDTVSQGNCALAPSNTVFVNGHGGMGNYTYSSIPTAITGSVNPNIPSGTYTIYVTDMNGCSTNTTYAIYLPPPFTATAVQIQSVTCNGFSNGAASVTIVGGTGAYTATWMPVNQQGQTIYNLAAGVYTVLVKDSRNCLISDTVQVFEPPILSITNLNSNPALCGNSNGGATVTVVGGLPPYTYTWSSVPIQTNSVAFGLTGGTTYSVFVEDQNNCIVWDTIFIPAPLPPLITSITFTPPTCHGFSNGAASVSFINGIPPISINWQPGNFPGTATIYNISSNVYTVTLTDANGCQTFTTINVTQPPALSLQVTPTHTICYGTNGTAQAIPDGGTPPYVYNWNPAIFVGGGPHPVSLTQTSQYIVSVTDANGCIIGPDTIKIVVLPPLLASGMSTFVCHNDTTSIWATLTSPGNGGPYTYTWTNGATTLTTNVVAFYPSQPNTYTIVISDGCSIPPAVAVSTVFVHPLPNGYFRADFVDGCPPLKVRFTAYSDSAVAYSWDFGNGETGFGSTVTSDYHQPQQYTVHMTMINQYGCTKDTVAIDYITVHPSPIADFELDKYETTLLEPVFTATNLSVGASQYLWDFGAPEQPNNTTAFANPTHTYLYVGEYDVTLVAINEYGCTDRITKKVNVLADYFIYIPNVFTPDGNGLNDVFQPKGLSIMEQPYRMEIYDRWGELIFVSENFNEGWNGKIKGTMGMAKNDVYAYRIILTDFGNKKHVFTGHVTLIGHSN
ncbi:MAG: gliding motility-associated C-terminal domain-containing protein, partial [Bacteroidia bacterium]|nr:gliding motility-associated C-terminal domain-containing protein [Bacteroidia bacterium]